MTDWLTQTLIEDAALSITAVLREHVQSGEDAGQFADKLLGCATKVLKMGAEAAGGPSIPGSVRIISVPNTTRWIASWVDSVEEVFGGERLYGNGSTPQQALARLQRATWNWNRTRARAILQRRRAETRELSRLAGWFK